MAEEWWRCLKGQQNNERSPTLNSSHYRRNNLPSKFLRGLSTPVRHSTPAIPINKLHECRKQFFLLSSSTTTTTTTTKRKNSPKKEQQDASKSCAKNVVHEKLSRILYASVDSPSTSRTRKRALTFSSPISSLASPLRDLDILLFIVRPMYAGRAQNKLIIIMLCAHICGLSRMSLSLR